jgi:hypothetical protein
MLSSASEPAFTYSDKRGMPKLGTNHRSVQSSYSENAGAGLGKLKGSMRGTSKLEMIPHRQYRR